MKQPGASLTIGRVVAGVVVMAPLVAFFLLNRAACEKRCAPYASRGGGSGCQCANPEATCEHWIPPKTETDADQ